jgi:branched-chain amino acid transport system permease protein
MAGGMTVAMPAGSSRRAQVALAALPVLALAVLPFAGMPPDYTRILFTALVWITASIAWNLLGGFAGQVSFGFAVFYGLGAYTAMMMMNRGFSPYTSFLGSMAVAVIASFLVGLPTFRLRGPYFTISTIGVTEAVRVMMNNLSITGGASGIHIEEHAQFHELDHYYSALVLAAGALCVSMLVANSRFGLALRAIRQDEDAAADLGVNPYRCKLWVHAIGAALTGAAGGVFAHRAAVIYPQDVFAFNVGIFILLMPVIGGIGTVWGAVLGGIVFVIIKESLVARFPKVHLLLYGALLVLIILFEPDGLAGLLRRLAGRTRILLGKQPA